MNVRRLFKRLTAKIATWFAPPVIKLISRTWRIKWVGEHPLDGEEPFVVSFWHQAIPGAVGAHLGHEICTMVSLNRDGEMMSRISKRLGFQSIRGSSSRRGGEALHKMIYEIPKSIPLSFTPDGPRGPKYSVAPGVLWASALAERRIFCMGLAADKVWKSNSWDEMFCPKPFAKIVINYQKFIEVTPSMMEDSDSRNLMRTKLKDSMMEAMHYSQEVLERWTD